MPMMRPLSLSGIEQNETSRFWGGAARKRWALAPWTSSGRSSSNSGITSRKFSDGAGSCGSARDATLRICSTKRPGPPVVGAAVAVRAPPAAG